MGAFGPGNTLKNLGLAVAGETYEIEEMYPSYMEVAKFQEENGAYRSFEWSYKTEKQHRALFEKAKAAVAEEKDVELGPIQVCEVCGYTLEGDAPDRCPVCGAERKRFTEFA
jgi:rubrerythrin